MSLSSPFSDWLDTNYSPDAKQAHQIQAYLNAPRNELAVLDAEVDAAERALNALRTKQARLRRHIAAHEALVHPIRRIPDELLQEIFQHCLPTRHMPTLSNRSAPILLTRVSRPWRALAFGTPTLWTSLHIPIPRGRSEADHIALTEARHAGVAWWFSRTGHIPLSISLYWPPSLVYAWGTGNYFPYLVLSVSKNLRELELDLPDGALGAFMEPAATKFPLLEKVVLRLPVPPDQTSRGVDITSARFWKAPKINRVVWESVDDDFFKLPLQWHEMKEIDIYGDPMIPSSFFSPHDALALVKATPVLESLRIELTVYPECQNRAPRGFAGQEVEDDADQALDSRTRLIVLNHLTFLDITDVYIDPDTGPGFMSNLKLPALTTLHYCLIGLSTFLPSLGSPSTSSQHRHCGSPLHPLIAFLRAQDKVIITKWKVAATSIPREVFVECLRLMPLLQKLHVSDGRAMFAEDPTNSSIPPPPPGMPFLGRDWSEDEDSNSSSHEDVVYGLVEEVGRDEGEHETSPSLPFLEYGRDQRELSPDSLVRERWRRATGKGKMGEMPNVVQKLRHTEVAPDDELLKAFVPSDVWWRESWDEPIEDAPSMSHGLPVVDMPPAPWGSRKGKERSYVGIGAWGERTRNAPSASWRGFERDAASWSGSSAGMDEGVEIGVPQKEEEEEEPLTAGLEGRRSSFPLSPDSEEIAEIAEVPEVPLRVPVPISLDTAESAPGESEILCPRLTSLRFDRARFTLPAIGTFVRARMALSTGASWMGQRKADSNRNENPAKEDWEERITEDFKRLKISSQSERDQGEDDEEESSTFFTANSSPSAAVSEVFLPSDPWPADPLSPDTAAGSSTADATVTGTLVSSTPTAAPHSPIGRAAPPLAGSLVTPSVPVASLEVVHVGLLYAHPRSDILRNRHRDKPPNPSTNAPIFDSRLSAELYEEYTMRLTMRFANSASVWGEQSANNSFSIPAFNGLGNSPGVQGTRVFDVSLGSSDPNASVDGGGEEARAAGIVRTRNDAREGIRGWRGPGSEYAEDDEIIAPWVW